MTEIVMDFNIDLAKRIKDGEVAGSFITDEGKNAEFVYISKEGVGEYPLLFVVEADPNIAIWVREDGMNEIGDYIKIKCDIRQAFKDGDVLVAYNGNPFLFNGIIDDSSSTVGYRCLVSLRSDILLIDDRNDSWIKIVEDGKYIRFATKEERRAFVDRLMADNSKEARGMLSTYFKYEVFNETEKLKPFDNVLVRDYSVGEWCIDLFHKTRVENGRTVYQCSGGKTWDECLPYEGNEHLLHV